MLYKVVLTFESVDEILNRDHSPESYGTVLSCGYYPLQFDSNFQVGLSVLTPVSLFKFELLSSTYYEFLSN